MPTELSLSQRGVTLIELVVFIVVVSIALTAMISAMNYNLVKSVDPVVQMRALECAQAKLDEISARKFDENSPTGGVPACGSAEAGAVACAGIAAEAQLDDVGDFAGQVDNSNPDCSISVTVVNAGGDLGLPADQARRVTVNVTSPGGGQATLSTYRSNF
ncbi:type II secretion system protein [Proteobacteria bacterium 005FR1]|nr:type II secretion system protein [Proteobacteria bacterium 005FR1]